MAEDRLFSESEVADIVRRAAELQESGSKEGYVPGITRSELLKMVKEVGIQPEFVEKAIQEGLGRKAAKAKFKLGETVEKVLPVEIRPEDFDVILEAIKLMPQFSNTGSSSGGLTQVGRTMQGQASGTWENPHFQISSRGGRTKIKVWTDNGIAYGLSCLWFIPLIFSILPGKLYGPLAGFGAAIACIIGAILGFRWLAVKGQETTRQLATTIENALMSASGSLRENLAATTSPEVNNETENLTDSQTS